MGRKQMFTYMYVYVTKKAKKLGKLYLKYLYKEYYEYLKKWEESIVSFIFIIQNSKHFVDVFSFLFKFNSYSQFFCWWILCATGVFQHRKTDRKGPRSGKFFFSKSIMSSSWASKKMAKAKILATRTQWFDSCGPVKEFYQNSDKMSIPYHSSKSDTDIWVFRHAFERYCRIQQNWFSGSKAMDPKIEFYAEKSHFFNILKLWTLERVRKCLISQFF